YVKQLQTKLPEWRLVPISAEKGVGLTRLKDEVYETLRFMRVFLKPQGKEADMADPLIVKAGSDVGMVCDAIHRDWRGRFRYANVWGLSAQFPGQKVGLDHGLQDSDVLTSTAGVFAPTPRDRPVTESAPVQTALPDPYVTSKVQAHQLAVAEMHAGLPLTIVLPAAVFGPGDTGQLGRTLALLARGRLPRLPRGFGVNTWTHAADIARGHVLAATRGKPGELYILGDRVLPVVEFCRKAEDAAG